QAIVLALDHAITLAHGPLQLQSVEHRDATAGIPDYPGPLKLTGGLCDTRARDAEHVGDQLLSHLQFVGLKAVQAKEQPSTQLLVDRVMAITDGGLRHLRDERLGIPQEHRLEGTAAVEFVVDVSGAEGEAFSGALNDAPTGCGHTPHE